MVKLYMRSYDPYDDEDYSEINSDSPFIILGE